MDPTLEYIVQWVRSGASHAKDPRLKLFASLYRSSTIDPHTLKVIKSENKITVKATLLYSTPDLVILKKLKKLVINRATKELVVSLEDASPEAKVILSHSRTFFELTLEEVLVLCNLYIIFKDRNKMKLFQQLMQGE